jgi:hypothetical protein
MQPDQEARVITKGPWEFNIFEEYPEKRGGYAIYALETMAGIAKVTASGVYSDYDPDKSDAHDNARLIAAAPELLDGCKAALSAMETLYKKHPELRDAATEGMQATLRETITEATGVTRLRSIKQATLS